MGHAASLGAAIAMAASLIAVEAEARSVTPDSPGAANSVEQPEPNSPAQAVEQPEPTSPAESAENPLPRDKPEPPAAVTGSLPDADEDHEKEAICLAKAIYFEARGEPIDGQFAVARVVLNRTASRRYPDTICDVVFQNAHRKNRCQFSFACDGKSDEADDPNSWALARGMAEALLRTERSILPEPVLRSTHYHARYVRPSWARKLTTTGQVGQHIFYVSVRRGYVSAQNRPTKSANAGYLRGQWR